ncbi:dihydrofolate reductase family protein [Clavibacter michiganensis]|uniref:dihydrofolate reductase family protein n=1 Tax=Clavibacter michiganensis TaxID=28447 RepID=UPI002158035C|nr:dihydrofolate reductase family protein [Clavibacter michiganensis]
MLGQGSRTARPGGPHDRRVHLGRLLHRGRLRVLRRRRGLGRVLGEAGSRAAGPTGRRPRRRAAPRVRGHHLPRERAAPRRRAGRRRARRVERPVDAHARDGHLLHPPRHARVGRRHHRRGRRGRDRPAPQGGVRAALRSPGSLSLNRSLLAAGLVDRLHLTVFPVVSGRTGTSPILRGVEDLQLELMESRVLDGGTLDLVYRPRLR